MDFAQNDLVKLITDVMPFGKYKGRTLIELPENYVLWFYDQGFPEGELGKLLGLLYEIKLNGLEELVMNIKKMQ